MFSLCLDVIDPCNRTGKISIPMQHVVGTKGVSDFQTNPAKRDGKELSLCLLFQKGRCNAGSKCHQVHADPEFIATLRERALSVKNCCASHGDVHSTGFLASHLPSNVIISGMDGVETSYPLACFGRTTYLDGILRSATTAHRPPRAPAAKICRLHAQSRCKFGKDCKNIHLCPDAKPVAQQTPTVVAVAVRPATPVPLRVVVPSVSPMNAPAAVDAPAAAISCCGLSSHKSSEESTPRAGGGDDSTVHNNSLAKGPLPLDSLSLQTSEQEFSCVTASSWGVASPQFDMSAFEETIRCLCLDLSSAKEDPLAVCPPARLASC